MCITIGYSQISTLEGPDSLEISDGVDNDCDSDTSPAITMNKGELVDAIAKDAGLSKADAGKALNAITSNFTETLKKGDAVQLIGFGHSISARAARTGRNPQTGATIKKRLGRVKYGNITLERTIPANEIQMNKGELVDAIAKDAGLSKADAGNALNAFMSIMSKELNNGNCVKLIVPVAINNGLRVNEGGNDADTDDDGLSDSLEISDGVDNDCDTDESGNKMKGFHDKKKGFSKSELIDTIANGTNLSKADAKRALEALTSNLTESLKKGNAVQLIGFGHSISVRAARTDRNPQTGATIKSGAKKVAKFKAGKALADTVKRTDNSQNPQGNGGEIQMNKGELVDAIAKDAGLSKADAGKALNAFIASMSKELNNGNCVKLIVPVAINKGIREGGKTVSADDGKNNKIQQGYTKESTMIFVKVDETSLRKSNTKIPEDNLIQENGKRMTKRTLRAREGNRKRVKNQALRTIDKRYSDKRDERVKARALRTADKRYQETIRGYRVRDKENTILNDKPVQITTEENNKVNPSNNLENRFLKAQNYQTIQISKSKFQLTAPLLISKDQNELINYDWTVKNKIQNKEDKFTGKTINYDFDVSGTYEIEITPVLNNKNLNSFHINIICN